MLGPLDSACAPLGAWSPQLEISFPVGEACGFTKHHAVLSLMF